ncbi:helix-turn-helix transcriptional regulator [Pseudophaeobacter sp. 1A16562]|uniref:helix-turn-helix transcriptional regulator n=1 Tax=Pseudophaeobacter sp. 1A16562 TaxID=3098143 RepID=UPI0034D3D305
MTSEREDFASAAMMRLVVAGLAAQGISSPQSAPAGAHVPRSTKRDVLEQVLAEHGPKAILAISDNAPLMPPEPVLIALRKAQSVPDLLDRWARLETFSHARHRIEAARTRTYDFTLNHVACDDGPPPGAAESLLVLGVITRLCEALGAEAVTLEDSKGRFWRKKGAWSSHPLGETIGQMILTAGEPQTQNAKPESVEQDVNTLRRAIADDPVRRWTVKSLARTARTSERTLQRRLSAHSTSFSQVLSEARLQVAADHLCAPNGFGLVEIGFLAGYADQSHFTRAFKLGVGTTPKEYRIAFQHR